MVTFEVVPTPGGATFTYQGAYHCPRDATQFWGWDACSFAVRTPVPADSLEPLPLAFRVTTGPKRPTTGSSLEIALPSDLVAPDGGALVAAYARLARRLTPRDEVYGPLRQYFDPRLRVLHVDILGVAFGDDRPFAGGNEALIVLAVARRP